MDETPIPPPLAATPKPPVNDVEENKDIAALGYAWILSIFVFMWKKDSPFVRFHAKQGMVLFVLSIIAWTIPLIGRFVELLVLALCVFGFLSAAQGQWKDLPIVGDVASGRWSHVRKSWQDAVASIVRLWKRFRSTMKKKADDVAPVSAEPATSPAVDATVVPSDTAPNPSSIPPHPNPNPNPPTL